MSTVKLSMTVNTNDHMDCEIVAYLIIQGAREMLKKHGLEMTEQLIIKGGEDITNKLSLPMNEREKTMMELIKRLRIDIYNRLQMIKQHSTYDSLTESLNDIDKVLKEKPSN